MDNNRPVDTSVSDSSFPSQETAVSLPSQKQSERKLITQYKKEARAEARQYLKEKKSSTDPDTRKAFRKKIEHDLGFSH